MTLHFTDVVDETKELPLSIHLGSTAQTESIQSLRVAEDCDWGYFSS
jgi:hypothetical protein